MELYKIDLPMPSEELVELGKEVILTAIKYAKSLDAKWLNEFHGNGTDSVSHYFGSHLESMELTNRIQQEYSHCFPGVELGSYYGIMRGDYATTGKLKTQPPHVDGSRNVNLNYYVELGGDDVQTWFYDVIGPMDRTEPVHYKKTEIDSLGYCKFNTKEWYLFNGNQCHSVENVKTDRYFFAITFVDNISDKRKRMLESSNLTNKFINPSAEGRSEYTLQDVLDVLQSSGINSTKMQLTHV